MKIYTSYFPKVNKLRERGIYPVAICQIPPTWFDGPNLASLAPSKDILFEYKANPDEKRYLYRYVEEILCAFRFHPEMITQALERMSGGKDVALCCYEKPSDFCHRHLLANWLNEKLGINITEYVFDEDVSYQCEELF